MRTDFIIPFQVEEAESGFQEPEFGMRKTTTSPRSRKSSFEQVVEFIIGDEQFAVSLFDTREVITTPEVTPIPNVPPFITGMIDLRGVITTIIDLRVLMHITRESSGKKLSRIIVLDKTVSEKMIGILVDDVSSVTTYVNEDIDMDAQSSQEGHRDIIGVIRKHAKDAEGKEARKLVIWLDIKKMIGRIKEEI
jgi:purine-binding chemotaxis protein CheW